MIKQFFTLLLCISFSLHAMKPTASSSSSAIFLPPNKRARLAQNAESARHEEEELISRQRAEIKERFLRKKEEEIRKAIQEKKDANHDGYKTAEE